MICYSVTRRLSSSVASVISGASLTDLIHHRHESLHPKSVPIERRIHYKTIFTTIFTIVVVDRVSLTASIYSLILSNPCSFVPQRPCLRRPCLLLCLHKPPPILHPQTFHSLPLLLTTSLPGSVVLSDPCSFVPERPYRPNCFNKILPFYYKLPPLWHPRTFHNLPLLHTSLPGPGRCCMASKRRPKSVAFFWSPFRARFSGCQSRLLKADGDKSWAF